MKAQCKDLNRISALPQETIEKILTLMPIRDAIRTSILSRKWRYSWRTMPKLAFDSMLIEPSENTETNEDKFVKAIFHVLLLHRAPILEFSISSTDKEIGGEIDQIILHLSRTNNNIKKIIFEILVGEGYQLPCSFFSLQRLEHLDLSYCLLELPSVNTGFRLLKSLRFYEVLITNETVFGFLTNCPLLEEFTWTSDDGYIELTEGELVELFKCLPSVQVLKISDLYIEHLAAGSMPHKLPISLVHLRILDLTLYCLELSSVLCVISSSPNLEKLKLEMCHDHDRSCLEQTFENLHDLEDYTDLNLDHFKELKITEFQASGSWMEFVKLVMARSPMLQKAEIELSTSVSVEEEIEMLCDLVRMPYPRASQTANLIIKRPNNYRR